MKWGFKKTIKWNKYQRKVTIQERNQYLGYLIYLSVQGVNRTFDEYSYSKKKILDQLWQHQ